MQSATAIPAVVLFPNGVSRCDIANLSPFLSSTGCVCKNVLPDMLAEALRLSDTVSCIISFTGAGSQSSALVTHLVGSDTAAAVGSGGAEAPAGSQIPDTHRPLLDESVTVGTAFLFLQVDL